MGNSSYGPTGGGYGNSDGGRNGGVGDGDGNGVMIFTVFPPFSL